MDYVPMIQVKVTRKDLVIRININDFCEYMESSDYFNSYDSTDAMPLKITNKKDFANAVADYMQLEREDGSNFIHTMLENSTVEACENGCDGVK